MEGSSDQDDTINVFSLASGHLYERFMNIMMLSVRKNTQKKVKFWLFEPPMSPKHKVCGEVELVEFARQ